MTINDHLAGLRSLALRPAVTLDQLAQAILADPPTPPTPQSCEPVIATDEGSPNNLTVFIRQLQYKKAVSCSACGAFARRHWTMILPFRAALPDGSASPMIPGLWPVCERHSMQPDPVIFDQALASFKHLARLYAEDLERQQLGEKN